MWLLATAWATLIAQHIAVLEQAIAQARARIAELKKAPTPDGAHPILGEALPEVTPCLQCPSRAAQDYSIAYPNVEIRATKVAWRQNEPAVLEGEVGKAGDLSVSVADAQFLCTTPGQLIVASAEEVRAVGPRGEFGYLPTTPIRGIQCTHGHVYVAEADEVVLLYAHNGTARVRIPLPEVAGISQAKYHAVVWSREELLLLNSQLNVQPLSCLQHLGSPIADVATGGKELLVATADELVLFALPKCRPLGRVPVRGVQRVFFANGFYLLLRTVGGRSVVRSLDRSLRAAWQRSWPRVKDVYVHKGPASDVLVVAGDEVHLVEVPRVLSVGTFTEKPAWWEAYLSYAPYVVALIGLFCWWKFKKPPPPTPEEMAEMMDALRTDKSQDQHRKDFEGDGREGTDLKYMMSQLPDNLKNELAGCLAGHS